MKKNRITKWELASKIDKAVSSNIKEIPWEGTDVNTHGLKSSFLEIIYELCPEYHPDYKSKEDEENWD